MCRALLSLLKALSTYHTGSGVETGDRNPVVNRVGLSKAHDTGEELTVEQG